MQELLFEFFTFTFPKAGILLGGIPFSAALILLALYVIIHARGVIRTIESKSILGWPYLIWIFFYVLVVFNNLNAESFTFRMAEGFLYMVSPLAILLGMKAHPLKALKVMYIAVCIVSVFAILQFFVGIEATKIPGLTIALNDSYARKMIGFGMNDVEAIKMPSTYQEGNSMGVFLLEMVPVLVWDLYKNRSFDRYRFLRILIVGLGCFGFFLSGSRSVIASSLLLVIPFTITLLRHFRKKQLVNLLILIPAFLFLLIVLDQKLQWGLWERFYHRYIEMTFFSTGGSSGTAGRIDQWMTLVNRMTESDPMMFLKTMLLGFSWKNAVIVEGFLYIFSCYGLFGLLSILILMIRPIRIGFQVHPFWGFSFLAVFFVLCVDRTFCSTPTLMNYFFMAGLALQLRKKRQVKV